MSYRDNVDFASQIPSMIYPISLIKKLKGRKLPDAKQLFSVTSSLLCRHDHPSGFDVEWLVKCGGASALSFFWQMFRAISIAVYKVFKVPGSWLLKCRASICNISHERSLSSAIFTYPFYDTTCFLKRFRQNASLDLLCWCRVDLNVDISGTT